MNNDAIDRLAAFFGEKFRDESARVKSYGLLEAVVVATPGESSVPDTVAGLNILTAELKTLTDLDLAFLITHTGFIPDQYGDDSCEETLYSKLVEGVLCEWGRRVGFTMALPTTKSSTEDVTFFAGNEVIVSDAKSFRLGRSQGAPNTKDALKPEDYGKWIARHTLKGHTAVGGLVAFPSKFDWRRGSDVYLYASNGLSGKRILILFYEHFAFLLLRKSTISPSSLFDILNRYDTIFPAPSRDRDSYWLKIDKQIEAVSKSEELAAFLTSASDVVAECVEKALTRIESRIETVAAEIRERVTGMDAAMLREALIASEIARTTTSDKKRLKNIKEFRL